jgi:hypothetical protein
MTDQVTDFVPSGHSTRREAAEASQRAAMARLVWETAVDQLVRAGFVTLLRDDGTIERAEVLPLLDQLAEAVMPGGEYTSGGGLGSKPPADLTALSLLAEISTEVRRCCAGHDHPHLAELGPQVDRWAAHAEQWQHDAPEYVCWAAAVAGDWVRRARLILDPPRRYTLRGRACPVCRATAVQTWSEDEGDFVRRPALAIDSDRTEVVCGACAQRWPLGAWTALAAKSTTDSESDGDHVPVVTESIDA